jgi:hypothetical protein
MRPFLQIAIPLLLPTLLYFLYVKMVRRSGSTTPPEVPWIWLGIAGAALVAVSIAAFSMMGGAPPGSVY